MQGKSSSFECAHQLGKLCENRHFIVNLIPYNATDVKDKLQCPSTEHMQEFRDIVASYGAFATIRRTMGADIAGACGQLVKKKQEEEEGTAVDIEDVAGIPANSQSKERTTSPIVQEADNVGREGAASHSWSFPDSSLSWLESLSDEALDRWTNALTVATAISASCFLASSLIFMKKR